MFRNLTYVIWLILFIGLPLLALLIIGRRVLWLKRAALGSMLGCIQFSTQPRKV